MARAQDVAAYIVAQRKAVEAIRLQKLLYYAQAWHLVTMDSPLFEEEITAFEYGPVVYSVWDKHRYKMTVLRRDEIGDPEALSDSEREVVDAVIDAYRRMMPFEMADLTHDEAPWADAWATPGDKRITKDAMRSYYSEESVKLAMNRTTPRIPRVPRARVTYVTDVEFRDIADSLDEPDDLSGLLAAVSRGRK